MKKLFSNAAGRNFSLLIAMALFLCSRSYADYHQEPVDIASLGSHDGFTFFMSLKQPLSASCAFSTLYCKNSNAECKSMLSVALAAKIASKPISVGYNIDSGNLCSI